jgi:hypothetical protein
MASVFASAIWYLDEHWDKKFLDEVPTGTLYSWEVLWDMNLTWQHSMWLCYIISWLALRWKCPLIKFWLMHDFGRKCDWSWMWCGNIVWIFVWTDSTMIPYWHENFPCQNFDYCIIFTENVIQECNMDFCVCRLHCVIFWLRQKYPFMKCWPAHRLCRKCD